MELKLSKTVDGLFIRVKIKVETHFSITGEVWKGKPRFDEANLISCGCIHEEILNHFPELEPIVRLHLTDLDGVPMHAVKNGIYHLCNGFGDLKLGQPGFGKKFFEVYRIGPEFIEDLKPLNELQYSIKLKELGILEKWNKQAIEAIELINSLPVIDKA